MAAKRQRGDCFGSARTDKAAAAVSACVAAKRSPPVAASVTSSAASADRPGSATPAAPASAARRVAGSAARTSERRSRASRRARLAASAACAPPDATRSRATLANLREPLQACRARRPSRSRHPRRERKYALDVRNERERKRARAHRTAAAAGRRRGAQRAAGCAQTSDHVDQVDRNLHVSSGNAVRRSALSHSSKLGVLCDATNERRKGGQGGQAAMAVAPGTNHEPRTHLPWRSGSPTVPLLSGWSVGVPLQHSIRLPMAFWSSCYFFSAFSAAPSDPA